MKEIVLKHVFYKHKLYSHSILVDIKFYTFRGIPHIKIIPLKKYVCTEIYANPDIDKSNLLYKYVKESKNLSYNKVLEMGFINIRYKHNILTVNEIKKLYNELQNEVIRRRGDKNV